MDTISVIIPCHDNQRVLPWILRSLAASGVTNLEVICVDDASNVDLKPIAEAFGARYVRLPEDNPGRRAMARNRGHQVARGNITLYLDGDVIPEPRIISAALQLHAKYPRVAVKYPVYNIPEVDHARSLPVLASLIISQDHMRLGPRVRTHPCSDIRLLPRRLRDRKTALWMLCVSHCTSIPWIEVERVGGWDENFLGWGEEDLELAYRLHLNGLRFIYPRPEHGAAYHLDHPIDWDVNLMSLNNNLRYFRIKFPDSWTGRRGLLRMFLQENNLPTIPAMVEDLSDCTRLA